MAKRYFWAPREVEWQSWRRVTKYSNMKVIGLLQFNFFLNKVGRPWCEAVAMWRTHLQQAYLSFGFITGMHWFHYWDNYLHSFVAIYCANIENCPASLGWLWKPLVPCLYFLFGVCCSAFPGPWVPGTNSAGGRSGPCGHLQPYSLSDVRTAVLSESRISAVFQLACIF